MQSKVLNWHWNMTNKQVFLTNTMCLRGFGGILEASSNSRKEAVHEIRTIASGVAGGYKLQVKVEVAGSPLPDDL